MDIEYVKSIGFVTIGLWVKYLEDEEMTYSRVNYIYKSKYYPYDHYVITDKHHVLVDDILESR